MHFRRPTLAEFEKLRDRYDVSITAAVLKWLEITPKRAMLVVSKDGFIDWARSSEPLFRSGVFFRARQETIAVPSLSLAAIGSSSASSEAAHPAGVWNMREPVFESVLFDEYRDLALSLLIYPHDGPSRRADVDEALDLMDTYDAFQR
jgi:hypothetical protein